MNDAQTPEEPFDLREHIRTHLRDLPEPVLDVITEGLEEFVGFEHPNTAPVARQMAKRVFLTVVVPLQSKAPEYDRNRFVKMLCVKARAFDRRALEPAVRTMAKRRARMDRWQLEEQLACAALVHIIYEM